MKKYTIEVTKEKNKSGCSLTLKNKGNIDDDIAKMIINHLLSKLKEYRLRVN